MKDAYLLERVDGYPLRPHARLATVFRMNPRVRRIVLFGLCLLLIGGLVLCGPAHHALHGLSTGDAHASDGGIYCDGCSLTGLVAPEPLFLCGPSQRWVEIRELPPIVIPTSTPPVLHSPRGPPLVA